MSNSKVNAKIKQQTVDCEEDRTTSMSVIGLQSLGNTSCLNSVLQNLLYLRPFREQLIYTMTRTEYKFIPKKHPELETLTFTSDMKPEPGKLTKELFKLINETAYQKFLRTATPGPVRNVMLGKSGVFKVSNDSQQDSHEFFRFLIDIMKDEEIKRLKTAFFDHFDINGNKTHFKNDPKDRKKLLRKYASEFENILSLTDTFIDETFNGNMISTVECDSCRKIVYTSEDFMDISLHLSADSKEVYTNDSLEFYLKQFFSPKFLEKGYVCNSCNPQRSKQAEASDTNSSSDRDKNMKKYDSDSIDYAPKLTSAVKQFHIKTVGPVLTIHLKRFSQTGYGLQKLNKRVQFPLVLDMSPFCFSDTSDPRDCNNQILYGLRGIVEHSAGTFAREYVSYVNIADWNFPVEITSKDNKTLEKRPNSHIYEHMTPTEEWYYIKDSHISRSDHDHVFSSQAYTLFYERLPLVTKFEQIGKTCKNSSEACETSDVAEKIREIPNPCLDQSYIHSDDRKEIRTKSMCVIGLQNLGYTSYLNSVLQNLLYLRPFRELVRQTMIRTKYKLVPKKDPELETLTVSYSKKAEPGKLTKELFKLMKETITEQSSRTIVTYNSFMPWAVQNEIADKSGKFPIGSQQDSHELFRFLIDMVKEEEIQRLKTAVFNHFDIIRHKTKFNNYSEDNEKLLEKYANEFASISLFNGTSIDEAFGGKMTSRVECLNCGKLISLNEVFLDISLPLEGAVKHKTNYLKQFLPKCLGDYFCNNYNPQLVGKQDKVTHTNVKSNEDKSKEVRRLNHMPTDYPEDSLEYYLMRLFSPILLEEDYACNYCDPQLISKQDENDDSDSIDYDALKFTSAVKQFHIKTVGPVLIIHLKRFSQTGYGLQKLNKPVVFPLVLDMSPFCVSDTSVLKDCNNQILYGLRGMVDHSGGMSGGHYVAYVNIADWNKPSKISSAKSSTARESNEEITSTDQPIDTDSSQRNENDTISLTPENSASKPLFQPTPTPDSHLYEHVIPTEDWYYISDNYVSRTYHDRVFSSQAYMLFYERLPLVPRGRVKEVGGVSKNNSVTCKTREAAAKSLEKSILSLNQSCIIENKQPDGCQDNRTKYMHVIGLSNLGNTCYFNSVLQNLLYLRPFREHLICTLTRIEYRLVLEKYPHLNTFINSDNKGEPRKLIKWLKLLRATTDQSESTKVSYSRNISRQNECLLRIVKCEYCGTTIQLKVSDNHKKICPEFPLLCPNKCLKSLIRKELESHIEKECPNTLITCPYKEMGCKMLSKRSELSKHEKTFESKHLDKTKVFYFNKVKKMQSIIQDQKNKNSESSRNNDCKDNRTKYMHVIGLYNLGNTCYFNSVLQNLLYLRPFKKRLIYTMTRTKYKLVPKKHPELETIEFSSEKKVEPGKLTQELFNLIQETVFQSEATEGTFDKKTLKKKFTQKIIKPRAVQIEIAKKQGKFSNGSQQDSRELFHFIVDMVKNEEIKRLNVAFQKHDFKTQSKNCSVDGKNLKKYASEFENIFVFTGTFIDDTFGGKMISTVKCEGCGNILNMNKDFLDISLPLPEYSQEYNILSCTQSQSEIESNPVEEVKRLNHIPHDYAKDSLEYYIMQFFSPKLLEKEYVCNDCNPQLVSKQDDTSDTSSNENDDTDSIDYDDLIRTNAVKQFHIKTVGPVLTIHLKRFSQTGYGLQKLNKPVVFPLVLDMSPFCVSDTSVLRDCNNQILYGLRGIVCHSGGMSAGHYVACVNIADWNKPFQPTPPLTSSSHLKHMTPTEEWYHISDSCISKTNHDLVFSSQAYILFYERLPLLIKDTMYCTKLMLSS